MLSGGRKRSRSERALERMLAGAAPPSFTQLDARILRKVRDPGVEVAEVAECLQWDAALVVRVLRTVNSAGYAPKTPIENVHHAVAYMGRAELERVVLALAVRRALPSAPAAGFDPRRFWVAASRRAVLARELAERLHPASAAECFVAGLLQDVAIPVMAHARPREYAPVLAEWRETGAGLAELERAALGWTHAEAGGLLGKAWELPGRLADSIFHHHQAGLTDVQLAPALKLVSVLGETERRLGSEGFVELGRSEYGLDPGGLERMLADSREKAVELAARMS